MFLKGLYKLVKVYFPVPVVVELVEYLEKETASLFLHERKREREREREVKIKRRARGVREEIHKREREKEEQQITD